MANTPEWQKREFNEVWDSFEWLIKDDLKRIDHRLKKMWDEAQRCGVRNPTIHEEINARFWKLWKDVASGEESA